ncbi:MAG TPA: hypothetical protein VNR38_18530 [Ureibacillus sp.]|nr:hypothetical protein [Ureibacillus sp.]
MKNRIFGKSLTGLALISVLLVGCVEVPVVTDDDNRSYPNASASKTETKGETTVTTSANTSTSKNDSSSTASTESAKVIVLGDTINSHFQADAICVVDSRFERGHRLVFRANILDASTNSTIEDAKVKVVLATGEEFEMVLGPHGEEATLLYSVGWTIPDDFPTGTLDYKYVAEVDGEEYIYEPFNVSLSKLTILEKGAEAQIAAQAQQATQETEEGSEESADGEGDA